MIPLTPGHLTPSQQGPYQAREPRVLILGGPGTGKTAVALLMARRILEEEPPGSTRRILFLTFSRAATSELLLRAPDVLAGEIGRRIDIVTFHSFAMAMLNAWRRFAGGTSELLAIVTREEQRLGLVTSGAVTFDDLIPTALSMLNTSPWLANEYRHRYAAVVCDEFQDTSAASASLLEQVARDVQLICLADADQVIFDWTDPSIRTRIDRFRESGARQYDLGFDSRRDPTNVIPRAAAAIRNRTFDDAAIRDARETGRLRVIQHASHDDPFDVIVDEIRSALSAGSREVGVFLATNRSVNQLAECLRRVDIEHEIVGLSGAAGESQIAVAACARFAVGEADWDECLRALGVFVAACHRGNPPPLAVSLARYPNSLDPAFAALLASERDALVGLAGFPVERLLASTGNLWKRLDGFRPYPLWDLGVRDLQGQTLRIRRRPLSSGTARVLGRVAESRRTQTFVDDIPIPSAPVRIMNVYQTKGREMDEVFLVHLPDDSDEWNHEGMNRLGRVHYVSISRARVRATIVLPCSPKSFFLPYASLGSDPG